MAGKRYQTAAFFIFLAVIQISALNYIEISGIKPDIFLAAVILIALYNGKGAGAEAGIIAGIIYGIATGGIFGIAIASFIICGYLAGVLGKNLYKEITILRCLTVFVFTIAYGLIYYAIYSVVQIRLFPFAFLAMHAVLPCSFYTALISPIIFLMLKKFLLSR